MAGGLGRRGSTPGPRPSCCGPSPGRTLARPADGRGGSRGNVEAQRSHGAHSTAWMNAYAERWIGSIKRECLSEFIVLGRRALGQILTEYVEHYHRERNHQGVGNRLLFAEDGLPSNGNVACRERLGGLLRFYHREAA
ncbi:MAG: integrase core domain-containing protein [Planctomycetota bacterium]|nr:integrase core domain-containing protein [Planctomycetota bacterium]